MKAIRQIALQVAFMALPAAALAEVSGPTADEDGVFTLTWNGPGTTLREVDPATGTVLNTFTGSSASFVRLPGLYRFQEVLCTIVPFSGHICVPSDTHDVAVGGAAAQPGADPLETQATFQFTLKSGDFDSDGRVDVLVDRVTPVRYDGSMQSYVLWQEEGGRVEARKPTQDELRLARGLQLATGLNLIPTDFNVDGFADHAVGNLRSVMGTKVADEHVVYAPGAAIDRTKPLEDVAVGDEFRNFHADLAKWLHDDKHFQQSATVTSVQKRTRSKAQEYSRRWTSK